MVEEILATQGGGGNPTAPTVGRPPWAARASKSWDHRAPSAGAGALEGGAERPLRRKEGETLLLLPAPTTLVSSVRNQSKGGRKCSRRNTEQGTQS